MLYQATKLDDQALAEVADLERRVVAADGGRLKLEWSVLRHRDGDQVNDLVWRENGRVVGFCGLYGFSDQLELAGMVDPAVRRCGIGTRLLTAAARLAVDRGLDTALLVTPRATDAGRAFAEHHRGTLHHSEHFLSLTAAPPAPDRHEDIGIRDATEQDFPALRRILAAAFGAPPEDTYLRPRDGERQLSLTRGEQVIGCLRIAGDADRSAIYGFAVDPSLQGQGIGRAVLSRVCRDLMEGGASHVTLEVAVDNDRALGLYTSVGFRRMTTEDYYAVATRPLADGG